MTTLQSKRSTSFGTECVQCREEHCPLKAPSFAARGMPAMCGSTKNAVAVSGPPQEFAEAYGFRFLAEDNIAANPAVAFLVESFAPTERFRPDKPYETRLEWRDLEGNEQSKLLLTKPETVIAEVLRGGILPSGGVAISRHRTASAYRLGSLSDSMN
jgi:hypothetical protein